MMYLGFIPFIFFLFCFCAIPFVILFLVFGYKSDSNTNEVQLNEDKSITEDAIEVVKMRYAKGEIDKKEYDEKIKDLKV